VYPRLVPQADDDGATLTLTHARETAALDESARLEVEIRSGSGAGRRILTQGPEALIGTLAECEVRLEDDTVSRKHAKLSALAQGILLTDLESKNGTRVEGVPVREALLDDGDEIIAGETHLRVARRARIEPVAVERFGDYATANSAFKAALAKLRKVAAGETTVLFEGETGTGKELLARAVHASSRRAQGPLVVVDCGSISANLLESHLFGHKKGAFTGAIDDHLGAFEEASKGTLFLDELGELPLDLQPKLLRALEARTVRPLGTNQDRPVDVRIVAATNKRLDEMVKEGRFRADLFYRVAVYRVAVPPLRERPEDVAVLVEHYAATLGGAGLSIGPGVFALLSGYDWPGNARELRNVIQRAIAVSDGRSIRPDDIFPGEAAEAPETPATFHEAKESVIHAFERRYVEALLARAEGNVSRASREAGLSRNALYSLMKRAGIAVPED
jgi:transcriptional regulator with PAS, ATPase and Fis domain